MERRPVPDLHVFYDSACVFCTRTARVLRRLDRGRHLRLSPLGSAAGMTDAPSQVRLVESLHVRDVSGQWFSGGEAWLRISDVVPALRPLGLIGRLPWGRPVVDLAYRWIAANRHRISRLVGDDR